MEKELKMLKRIKKELQKEINDTKSELSLSERPLSSYSSS
jgi:hypothetical protein